MSTMLSVTRPGECSPRHHQQAGTGVPPLEVYAGFAPQYADADRTAKVVIGLEPWLYLFRMSGMEAFAPRQRGAGAGSRKVQPCPVPSRQSAAFDALDKHRGQVGFRGRT